MGRFRRLSEEFARTRGASRPLKICLVTSEILGPVKNGGIGTATSGLVEHLTGDGHRVTVLFTSVEYGIPACDEKDWPYWVATLARRNVELAHIPHEGDYRMWRRKSWLVKEFLAERDFDVVYFNEHHGSGYYALAAKRAGLPAFAGRTHCVITHGSMEWVLNTNEQYIGRPSDLEMMGLERRSVEWADFVLSPSEYLLREYETYGWRLPERTYAQPYPFPILGIGPDSTVAEVSELVFFGRLEPRKGLWLFCEALDLLAERLRGHVVTFMGRVTHVGGVPSAALILERSARWPFQVRLLTRFGQEEALDYLRQPGRLAVMPSLADNSPCVIYECMGDRIPFIAASGSGADELVHPDCWNRVMVEPNSQALSDRLRDVLDHGAGLAWPRFDAAENLRTWSAWHDWHGAQLDKAGPDTPTEDSPSVLVEKRMLLVTIDNNGCTLSGLSNRLGLHLQRFGQSLRHVVLTSRLGRARDLLRETLAPLDLEMGTDLVVLDPESVGSVVEIIGSAEIVFFTDAEHEILPAFFVAAVAAMAQEGAAAVSCVSADQRGSNGPLEIVELPCGDLPAAGGLGLPIGSSVWGARSEDVLEELTDESFYQPETGDLIDAAQLGQALMHKMKMCNKQVLLVPAVGAVRKRDVGASRQRSHWYQEAKETAQSLGVVPFASPNGVGWVGINIARAARSVKAETVSGLDLHPDHPLNFVPHTGQSLADLALLAAALGRPDQAVRLHAGWDSNLYTSATLLDVAQKAAEARERIDLRLALQAQSSRPQRLALASREGSSDAAPHDFRDRLIAAIARQKVVDRRDVPDASVPSTNDAPHYGALTERLPDLSFSGSAPALSRAYSDVFWMDHAADYDKVRLTTIRSTHSGRLTFIDVPLTGHQRAVVDLTLERQLPVRISLSVVDQVTGGEIARADTEGVHRGVIRLAADLQGIFGVASVLLLFETGNDALRFPLSFELNRFLID